MEQMVVMVHQGYYEGCDSGTMIVVASMNYLPDDVHNIFDSSDILFAGSQLEVAHLTVEGRRHLSLCKGHGEFSEECHAEDAKVGRETLGMNDGARTDIDECAAFEVAVLQVEVDFSLAAHDDA